MDPLFIWIETTRFSVWMRESPSVLAFPTILTLHTVGLAFLAGPSAAIDLRILGGVDRRALAPMRQLFPLMWGGFWLNAATGLALVWSYPTKALTNPLFYVKLLLIALALVALRSIQVRVFGVRGAAVSEVLGGRERLLAGGSIALWLGVIFAGRFLAYTYHRLLAYAGI